MERNKKGAVVWGDGSSNSHLLGVTSMQEAEICFIYNFVYLCMSKTHLSDNFMSSQ